ncbi:F-box/kelch-repeat protein At3g06240-like [Cornus florida]|uniref:F-box/kelch-repeat protein At3g06240-like n=1 Tax=Cornus florida TaxID=4283 RepID=UPI00289BD86A|nr:F-box/kelch-repeat protein At3g06240-like [Cornus florida]
MEDSRTTTGSGRKAVPILPPDLLVSILLKLPAKSLLRCRCVSRSWLSLISQPQFIKNHLNLSIKSPTQNILLTTFDTNDWIYTANLGAFDNVIVAQKLDYILDHKPHDLPQIIGSHNGLVCVIFNMIIQEELYCLFYVSNLSTRVYKQIEYFNLPHCANFHIHGFGYDHSVDDYKVLKGSEYGVYVYSLRTDSWKKVVQDFPIKSIGGDFSYQGIVKDSGTHLNGAIHWLCSITSKRPLTIVAFDLVDEIFRKIPLPDLSSVDFDRRTIKLEVFGGCLCILPMCAREFLVMKEYGVKQSWTKIEIAIPHPGNVYPWACLKNDEVLLKLDHEKFVLYNTGERTYRDLDLCGVPARVILSYKDTYLDTLVSPIMVHETRSQKRQCQASQRGQCQPRQRRQCLASQRRQCVASQSYADECEEVGEH